jgi:uncharacterized membrane protein YkvA (DUF1232 family)
LRAPEVWAQKLHSLKRETYTLYFMLRDPRVPWYAKGIAACAIGYTFSPIQLIPDWIPVFGFADDFFFLALAVALMRRVTPPTVLAEFRERAAATMAQQAAAPHGAATRIAVAVVLTTWLLIGALGSILLWRAF